MTNDRSVSRILLFALAFLVMVPVTLPVPALKEIVTDRFAVTEFQTAWFMSFNMVGAFLAAPLAGAVSDWLGRRRPLIVAALSIDAALFWAMTFDISFSTFMTLRCLEGAAHIFALSTLMALAADAAGTRHRGRVMGIVGAAIMLGVAFGAPLGGALGSRDGFPLRVGASIAAGAALLSLLLPEVTGSRRRPTFKAILDALRGDPWLLVPVAFAFIDRFTVGFYTTSFSFYVKNIHGQSSAQVGMLLAMFLLPFGLLSYPFGRLSERYSRARLTCVGSILYGIGTLSITHWHPDFLPIVMLLLGVCSAVMFVPTLVMTTDLASPALKGTAMGAFNSAGSLGFIVGPLTGGLVAQTVADSHGARAGYQAAFAAAGLSELVCVLITVPFLIRLVRSGRTT